MTKPSLESDLVPEQPYVEAILLDRDGVINRKLPEGRYVTAWSEFVFLPGVREALAEVAAAGIPALIVTNQRGVARGLLTEQTLQQIHERMQAEIAVAGGQIDAVYYCPHEGSCDCRKPRTGLLERAARDFNFDLANTIVIGDRLSDIQAGLAAGSAVVLIASDLDEPLAAELADYVADNLSDAVRWCLAPTRYHRSHR